MKFAVGEGYIYIYMHERIRLTITPVIEEGVLHPHYTIDIFHKGLDNEIIDLSDKRVVSYSGSACFSAIKMVKQEKYP